MYQSSFEALRQHKDDPAHAEPVEGTRASLQDIFERYALSTLSRVVYLSRGASDIVTHGVGMPDAYAVCNKVVGPEVLLRNIRGGAPTCEALFGSGGWLAVNDVYAWISGKDACIWRMARRPAETTACAVAFGSHGGWFLINALDGIDEIENSEYALGIRVVGAEELRSR